MPESYLSYYRYFNSQPHKEADHFERYQGRWRIISTHSLTRRLTGYGQDTITGYTISTHSLTRRLTLRNTSADWGKCISTHSLTRRLTENRFSYRILHNYFNSQPHKEADRTPHETLRAMFIFQLTASQGG